MQHVLHAIGLLIIPLEHQVFREREVEDEPAGLTVFGNVRKTLLGSCADGRARDVLPGERHRARRDGRKPRNSVRDLHLAVARNARDGEDLARAHGERHVAYNGESVVVFHAEMVDVQHRRAELRRLFSQLKAHLAAHHARGHLLRGGGGDVAHAHKAAAAQNGAAVGDLLDLLELVRDEDDRLALAAHLADDLKQKLDLLRREDGRRLVENEDLRLAVQHFQDLDALLHRDVQILDLLRRVHLKAELFRELRHFLVGALHVHGGEDAGDAAARLHAEDDVLRDGVVRHQLEVLVHHADVQLGGVVRREGLHFLAADVHLALVRLIHAEQNAHQRGLSGAVFAQQREDLALFDAEADVVVGYDAGKAFGDMTHFHNIVVHLVLLFLKGLPPRGGARKKKRDTPRNGGVSLSDMLKTCSALTVRGTPRGCSR